MSCGIVQCSEPSIQKQLSVTTAVNNERPRARILDDLFRTGLYARALIEERVVPDPMSAQGVSAVGNKTAHGVSQRQGP